MEYQTVTHTFEPIYNESSRILILGSLPSVKSRENNFYYGHPQNRFWKVLAQITGSKEPLTIADKKKFLLENKIAVWDVIAKCDIKGSSDSSIKNVIPCDLSIVLDNAPIEKIIANGTKAYELYMKYCFPRYHREIIKLPSTSPANATYNIDRLCKEWEKHIDFQNNKMYTIF